LVVRVLWVDVRMLWVVVRVLWVDVGECCGWLCYGWMLKCYGCMLVLWVDVMVLWAVVRVLWVVCLGAVCGC